MTPRSFGIAFGVWIGLWLSFSIAVEPSLAKRFGYGAALSTFLQIFSFAVTFALFIRLAKGNSN